jgi:hypothetical protein
VSEREAVCLFVCFSRFLFASRYTAEAAGVVAEWRVEEANVVATGREVRLDRPVAPAVAPPREPPVRHPRGDWHARVEIRTSDLAKGDFFLVS